MIDINIIKKLLSEWKKLNPSYARWSLFLTNIFVDGEKSLYGVSNETTPPHIFLLHQLDIWHAFNRKELSVEELFTLIEIISRPIPQNTEEKLKQLLENFKRDVVQALPPILVEACSVLQKHHESLNIDNFKVLYKTLPLLEQYFNKICSNASEYITLLNLKERENYPRFRSDHPNYYQLTELEKNELEKFKAIGNAIEFIASKKLLSQCFETIKNEFNSHHLYSLKNHLVDSEILINFAQAIKALELKNILREDLIEYINGLMSNAGSKSILNTYTNSIIELIGLLHLRNKLELLPKIIKHAKTASKDYIFNLISELMQETPKLDPISFDEFWDMLIENPYSRLFSITNIIEKVPNLAQAKNIQLLMSIKDSSSGYYFLEFLKTMAKSKLIYLLTEEDFKRVLNHRGELQRLIYLIEAFPEVITNEKAKNALLDNLGSAFYIRWAIDAFKINDLLAYSTLR